MTTTRTLADGNEIPLLGLGVWQVPDGRQCEDAVRWALELGYRHIDTAQAYGNERSVGKALRDSGVPREDVFITTKFYPARKDPEAEAQRSLERLEIEQVDLYIIHWPAGRPDVGVGRDAARPGGAATRARSASRTSPPPSSTSSTPWPTSSRSSTRSSSARSSSAAGCCEACEAREIALEAYSPLGTGRHLDDAAVGDDRRARSAARPRRS